MIAAVQPSITFPPDVFPPNVPPTIPTPPPNTAPVAGFEPVLGSPEVNADAARAIELIKEYVELLVPIRHDTVGADSTKETRIAAFNLNMDAQKLLEKHFETADRATVYALRAADAMLEDVNWQLAKKPSPDGAFNGVNVPGAIRDSRAAIQQLSVFVNQAPQFPSSPPRPYEPVPANPAPFDPGPQPGDPDYCRTPEFGGRYGAN